MDLPRASTGSGVAAAYAFARDGVVIAESRIEDQHHRGQSHGSNMLGKIVECRRSVSILFEVDGLRGFSRDGNDVVVAARVAAFRKSGVADHFVVEVLRRGNAIDGGDKFAD